MKNNICSKCWRRRDLYFQFCFWGANNRVVNIPL